MFAPRPVFFLRAELALVFVLLRPGSVAGQNRIGTGDAAELFTRYCATCHGERLQGGTGSNLVDGEWKHAETDREIANVIKAGLPDMGMTPFGSVLSDEQIRSLVIYLREEALLQGQDALVERMRPSDGLYATEHHRFRLEEVAKLDGVLWSLAFLPDASILATERGGRLYHWKAGSVESIEGLPEVRAQGQGGLLEVALHPDFSRNGWIYLGYVHRARYAGNDDLGMTRVVRGRIRDHRWVDEEPIFTAPAETYLSTHHHFGTRFVFQDGYLFFPIGDRGRREMAQDLSKPNGKIHRIHDDGRIPADNPFVDREGAFPSIWSYGHRNPQGLAADPRTGDLWETEHGPRGGDETNLIRRGANYGWPVITYGMNYNGTPITDLTAQEGMEQPAHYWTPSIAVCGIDFYEGDRFPHWKNNLLVAGLASRELHRLVIEDRKVVADEIILKNEGRVRDVATGPEGLIYLILMNNGRSAGRICRLVPVN